MPKARKAKKARLPAGDPPTWVVMGLGACRLYDLRRDLLGLIEDDDDDRAAAIRARLAGVDIAVEELEHVAQQLGGFDFDPDDRPHDPLEGRRWTP